MALGIRWALVGVSTLLGSGLALAAGGTDTSNVAYNWTKGTSVHYRWTEMSDQAMTAGPGMDSKTQNGRIATVTWMVEDVTADGQAKIKMTYNGYAVTSQLQRTPEPMKWDSLAPSATDVTNPMAMIFGHILGESISFTVDRRGMVSKVEGMENLAKKLRQAAVDTPGAGTFVNAIQTNFTEKQMKANLERVLAVNPDKAVKAEETWSDSMDVPYPQFGSFKMERTHTLDLIDKSVAKVGVQAKITLNEPADGDPAKPMFAMMSPKITDGKAVGHRIINLEKGFVQESKLTMTVPIEMTMSAQNMTIKNNLVTNIALERLEQLPNGAVIPGVTPIPTPPSPPKTVPPSAPAPLPGDINLSPNQKK